MDLSKYISRIRISILFAVCALAGIALYSLRLDQANIAGIASAGIIALGKDIIAGDSDK